MTKKITKNFKTKNDLNVTLIGELKGKKIKTDFDVEGHGSQGGYVNRFTVTHNGVDYAATVGKLPLTDDQLNVYDDMMKELTEAKKEYEKAIEEDAYGTYEEVEINHPWMKNTY